MPLYILGLTLLVGLLIFQIVKITKLNKYERRTTTKRRNNTQSEEETQEKTLYFPTDNIEAEKHKRNIH